MLQLKILIVCAAVSFSACVLLTVVKCHQYLDELDNSEKLRVLERELKRPFLWVSFGITILGIMVLDYQQDLSDRKASAIVPIQSYQPHVPQNTPPENKESLKAPFKYKKFRTNYTEKTP